MSRCSLRLREQEACSNQKLMYSQILTPEAKAQDSAEPPLKKRRTRLPKLKCASTRQKVEEDGTLSRLTKDVPLDVILEIFCYLDSGDLLRLARSSKDLRGILMSKSSENIWRTARENVKGIPPLPDDLNEPQYAHLLFESYCHVCGSAERCDTVLWSFRTRLCQNCGLAGFPLYDARFIRAYYPFCSVFPSVYISDQKTARRVGNTAIAERLLAEYQALQTRECRKKWIARKSQELAILNEHGRLFEEWQNNMRQQRRAAILNRLAEIGWREEAEHDIYHQPEQNSFFKHKLVDQPTKLTEHDWNSIKNELIRLLAAYKKKRLADERQVILQARYESLAGEYQIIESESDLREPFPALGDILTNKIFEDLIWDTPQDKSMTVEFFRGKLLEHLPRIIEQWRPSKIQEVVGIIQKTVPSATVSDLHLVVSVFKCKKCHKPMHYPQMFYHECCFQDRSSNRCSNRRMKTYRSDYPTHCGLWSSHPIAFDTVTSQIAQTIVKSCSLDPATTTINQLHSLDPLFECKDCTRVSVTRRTVLPTRGRIFMRWLFALEHSREHCPEIHPSTDDLTTEQISACERVKEQHVCCAYCHKSYRIVDILDHLKASCSDRDPIDISSFTVDSIRSLVAFQEHWYRNPRVRFSSLSNQRFRYDPAKYYEYFRR